MERIDETKKISGTRKGRVTRPIASLIAGAMIATTGLPATARAAEDGSRDSRSGLETFFDVWRSAVDVAVLRPLGVGRLVMGGVLLVPSTLFNTIGLPFGRDTSVFVEDFDRFLVEPAEYTFKRPVGEDLVGS